MTENMESSRDSMDTILNLSAYQSVISDRNRLNVQRIDDDDSMDSVSSTSSAVRREQRSELGLFKGFTRKDIRRPSDAKKTSVRDNLENDVR